MSPSLSPASLLANWISGLPQDVSHVLLATLVPLKVYAGMPGNSGIPRPTELKNWLLGGGDIDPSIPASKVLTVVAHFGPELEKRADHAWWETFAEHLRTVARNTVDELIEEGRGHYLSEVDRMVAGLPEEEALWKKVISEWRALVASALAPASLRQWASSVTAEQIQLTAGEST